MNEDYWLRQSDKPLYPELEWSRPENKTQAGKLLIVGGNKYGFVAPGEAYAVADKAGVGNVRMVLPDSLRPYVGKTFANGSLAPTTPSGSLSLSSLATVMDEAAWADSVLLPGDIGKNSETSILLEHFLEKYAGQVTATKDVADFLCDNPLPILHREDTLMVLAIGQLRRLGNSARFPRAFTSEMDLVRMVDALHEFTKRFAPYIITRHQDNYIVALKGKVSTTKIMAEKPVWRIETATKASVWWLQNPSKPFEALTTSVL